ALGAPSAQTAATSQFTKRDKARPTPGRASQPPQKSPPPGTACREETWWASELRAPTKSEAKSCPGRPRRIVARRLGLLDFVAARLRASCSDSSQLFERSGLRREVSSATGHEIEQTQGSRCKAP